MTKDLVEIEQAMIPIHSNGGGQMRPRQFAHYDGRVMLVAAKLTMSPIKKM